MTRTQPEARIVNAILDKLNALPQTYARKTHGNRYSVGWPDIIGTHHGRMIALEVKQPGKDATPRQAHELARWERAGALVGVVHDVDEALRAIGHAPALLAAFVSKQGDRYMRVVREHDSSGAPCVCSTARAKRVLAGEPEFPPADTA